MTHIAHPAGPPGTALRQARHLFLEGREIPPGLVDDRLIRSWQRSRQAGLQPLGQARGESRLGGPALNRFLDKHREFLDHAQPILEYLYDQVRDTHSMVILADSRGLLLHALGDADFLTKAERVLLTPGASWHERDRGTNAIGTALAEGTPMEILGSEHFLERNAILACSAAPVRGPDGQLLGVVDISCDRRHHHPHTRGLVQTAARMIENRLLLSRHRRQLRLHFHPREEGIGTVAEGVAALSEDGWVVAANRAALTWLGLTPGDMGAVPLKRLLDIPEDRLREWGLRHPEQSLAVQSSQGQTLFVQVRNAHPALAPSSETRPPQDALASLGGADEQIGQLLHKARRVLGKPIPVLLQGESGVGKERFAQAMHQSGPRRERPFVAVNCAALPEHLIEAELFGYRPGAFTGARRDGSPGRIREAQGGTLFLDEIGDMPLGLQSRLLRVLQERQVVPLGGGAPVDVDFALICATHCHLRDAVEAGHFRTDLYYRINGLSLTLPPLRQRQDFADLVRAMLAQIAPGRPLMLAPGLARAMAAYAWPGNLRQLSNALHTAVALLDEGEDIIDWGHLADDLAEALVTPTERHSAPEYAPAAAPGEPGDNLKAQSEAAIARAVAAAQGNLSLAARRLGISRNTLYRHLRRPT